MTNFTVDTITPVTLEGQPSLISLYTLSPFVWREAEGYSLLLRIVPRSDNAAEKISRIHAGSSKDGLRFALDTHPVIAPGPGPEDGDGCEDPTVVVTDGETLVYYSGWNEAEKCGSLLLASGSDCHHLQKRGVRLSSEAGYANPKESTLVQVPDGSWRLFFEYAEDGASKIGLVSAPAMTGPWTPLPCPVGARPGRWDRWHLSPGPVLRENSPNPVMFYNGATQETQWRIGWIVFNADYTQIVERSEDPLIVPPPPAPGDTDIAFAASCVADGDGAYLYYSVADKDLFRASLRGG